MLLSQGEGMRPGASSTWRAPGMSRPHEECAQAWIAFNGGARLVYRCAREAAVASVDRLAQRSGDAAIGDPADCFRHGTEEGSIHEGKYSEIGRSARLG